MRHFLGLVALSLAFATHASEDSLHVRAEGLVAHAGSIALPASARNADAALAAAPSGDAYVLGAALIRRSLIDHQTQLRAGILYDFSEIARRAGEREDDAVGDAAVRMAAWLRATPVTGRQPALLDPRVVEVTADQNLPLQDGDTLHYPARPTTVRVVGAVREPCNVAFVPAKDARRYLADCAGTAAADGDTFYVIQPDGHVLALGRALWNRSDAQALAPGAVLYVPIKASATRVVDPELDRDVAEFLGTQVLR